MERRRTESPVFARELSGDSSSTGSTSPVMSPALPQSRVGSMKQRNAAAQHLAQVMAYRTVDDDDEEEEDDDLGFRFSAPPPTAFSGSNKKNGVTAIPPISASRPNRTQSLALGRNSVEQSLPVRSTSAGISEVSIRPTTTMVAPPSKSTIRTPVAIPPIDPPTNRIRDRRFPSDIRQLNLKDTGEQREVSALLDELDMLEEENEIIIDKLRHEEKRREGAEARARELEKQVASLGVGVSLEDKLLIRKEAALRQREAALEAATQTQDGRDKDMAALHVEIQNLKDDTEAAIEQQQEAEAESVALRSMTQRMILSEEEMEEVVLKRCWLSRYWGLAVKHGICAEIAPPKNEYWSSLAPLPFEVVSSAGQKAKEESWNKRHGSDADDPDRNKPVCHFSDLTGEGNIEGMLSVEMGLRQLASLKVEVAVVLALAQHKSPNLDRQSVLDSTSLGDPKFVEAFELSDEESEDVLFKEAWLIYFWRRALFHGVEEDVAEERLQFWISRSGKSPTSHDAVDVERGLLELRKLGIEQQLWGASRKEIDQPSGLAVAIRKVSTDSESSS